MVDLDSGVMIGVEALIRWIEPDGTLVPPGEFIPLAEELGLIEPIGDWVVRELPYQDKAWRELGIDLEVGFNLSPRQFWQPDLAERIVTRIRTRRHRPSPRDGRDHRVLRDDGSRPRAADPVGAAPRGVRVAIDDFGTGYSSLSRLREMPVRRAEDRPVVRRRTSTPTRRSASHRDARSSSSAAGWA